MRPLDGRFDIAAQFASRVESCALAGIFWCVVNRNAVVLDAGLVVPGRGYKISRTASSTSIETLCSRN